MEEYLSLSEIKELLEREKAERGELKPEQQYALTHADTFANIPTEAVPKIVKELMEIPMMSLANAIKIIDVAPKHGDDVRAIFAKERYALAKEDMDRVLQVLAPYL